MNDLEEVTREDEIASPWVGRPHVVILGAGASRASFPAGDRNGKVVPLMNDLIPVLDLESLLSKTGLNLEGKNFEDVYAAMDQNDMHVAVKEEVEQVVHEYFSSLKIGNAPTIYDHLLLSLREKDVVATFNWDPFLTQAYRRNKTRFRLPQMLFLHGNVAMGYCERCDIVGQTGRVCKECSAPYTPSKLLYPVRRKDYHLSPFIRKQWEVIRSHLDSAYIVSVFGYGAPKTDVGAVTLLKRARGSLLKHSAAEFEIIDVKPCDELIRTWRPFIYSDHYSISRDFYGSCLSTHPRRTCEALFCQTVDGRLMEGNPIPRSFDFPDLWDWFRALQDSEGRPREQP